MKFYPTVKSLIFINRDGKYFFEKVIGYLRRIDSVPSYNKY